MHKSRYLPWIAAAGFAASLVMVFPAFAATQGNMMSGELGVRFGMRGSAVAPTPGVVGTVTAVDGSTLTVLSKMRQHVTSTTATATSTTYTVNAAGAQVFKNGATSTLASIATGDMVMVQGTVSGTSVTATVIRDGTGGMMGKRGLPESAGKGPGWKAASSTPIIQGNGQPVIGGAVASIGSTTLTVTNASNVTYTIDASGAKIVKNGTSTAFAGVAIGDNVIVQGTVNGTSVIASSIIVQGNGNHGSVTATSTSFGFFGSIGNFFKHLFGF